MVRLLSIPVVLLAVMLALLLLERGEERADLVLASDNEIFTLDPQRMSWLGDMRMAYALYEGLVRWNPEDFTIQPAVARSWTVSDDGLTWTFQLDPDAVWSDGAPVTAHDFVWAWKRLLLPDTAADYSNLLFAVQGARELLMWRSEQLAGFSPSPGAAEALLAETDRRFDASVGIRAVGPHRLELQLVHPVPYLLDLLAFAPLMPVYRPAVEGWTLDQATWDAARRDGWHTINPPPWSQRGFVEVSESTGRLQPDHRWARPGTLVGNGPYVLDTWRYRRDLRLVRRPEGSQADEGMPDHILLRSFPDPNTALLAFRSGEVDWLTGVSSDVRRDLLDQAATGVDGDEPRLTRSIHAIPAYGTDFFSFNCRPTLTSGLPNPFSDAAVRRAFALATDKQSIVDHVTGLREPVASTMTPPRSISGYTPPQGLGHDPDRAVDELASAGWYRDADGTLADAAGTPFPSVELLYTTSSPRHRRIAAALRDQWSKALGVDVHLVSKDSKAFGADLRAGDFMIARGRWYGDWGDPTTFLELFRSTDGNNDRGFVDADIDAALAAAAAERDAPTRMNMLAAIEQSLFQEHMPLLPICQIVEVTMHDPTALSGMTTHPRLVQYLGDVRILQDQHP
ncbi:MAG: peptide ABC transporter substrate-binding protein [Phycisphaerales bacterium]|nr:peptide ABC transporter substrate-binding protein [Phycisphaerales bacterium]